MAEQFKKILSGYQEAIDKEIEKFFVRKINQAEASFEKEVLAWLKEYSLRDAKRIRPILVNLGYFLAGGQNKKAVLKTSIFVELIHNYLLIHDDIIDKDELRRNKKTLHRLYGQEMAICAGDVASALGYEVLSSAPFPVECRLKALIKLNQTLYFTGYGQMLELRLKEKIRQGKKAREEELSAVHMHKTAFYTLVNPLQIGALLAGAPEQFLKKIEKFALPLGIAFQIRDDLADGEIEKVFGFDKAKYQKKQEQLVAQAKKSLILEKAFPQKQKEFLLNLADYTNHKR